MNIEQLAGQMGYPVKVIQTLLLTLALPPDGSVLPVRFESARFQRYCGGLVDVIEPNQAGEWLAYQRASRMYPTYAKLSTRWGIGLVGGWDFLLAGYTSVEAMVADFATIEGQVGGWLRLMKNTNKRVDKALKAADWRSFVSLHIGAVGYDEWIVKLETTYRNL